MSRQLTLICILAAVALSTAANNVERRVVSDGLKGAFYRQKYNDSQLSAREKICYLDSLIALHPSDTRNLLEDKIQLCYDCAEFNSVISTYDSLERHSQEIPVHKMCRYMLMRGIAFSNSGQFNCLAQSMPDLLALQKPDSLCYYDAAAYELISNLSLQLQTKGEPNAIANVEQILKNAQAKNLSPRVIGKIKKSLISMRADSAMSVNDYNETLKHQEELLRLALDKDERIGVKLNIGMTYLYMGKDDMALDIFTGILGEAPFHRNHGMALVNAMHVLNNQARYNEAVELYEAHKDAASYIDRSIGMAYLDGNHALALAGTGMYEEAFPLMAKAMQMTDSIRVTLGFREGDLRMELSKAETAIKEMKKTDATHRAVAWAAIILSIIGFVAAATFAVRLRKLKTKNDAMTDNLNTAREKNISSTSDFLRLARVNEAMELIDSICQDKKTSDNEKIKRIMSQLGNVELQENSWDVFRHNFEGLHTGFFKNLKEHHPDISTGEMRMCAYVVMQLPSKEIAVITGRTIRSVESMRYRIQKKLGISGKDSLSNYLLSLTQ